MKTESTNQTSLPSRAVSFLAAILATCAFACADADVDINNLEVEPDAANKGESLRVAGKVETLTEIRSITFTVLDDKDAPVASNAGMSVSNNALPESRINWDLRIQGDVKVVTSPSTPSGTYRLKVEATTKEKSDVETVTFTVR